MEQFKTIHNEIFVSDRIVTYKAAAAILKINVNDAKKVLQKYVNNVTDLSDKDELYVSYVIGGINGTNENKLRIVPRNKYIKAKSCFKTITIDHVYSIQKSPLVDWTPIFNVDDLLYDKNDPPKQEVDNTPETKKEVKTSQTVNKIGGISNFFNNDKQKKTSTNPKSPKVAEKQETQNNNKKQEKTTAFTNFFSKTGNIENLDKVHDTVKKEQVNSAHEDEFGKVSKKRSRVSNDDDENVNPTKCPKVDILDDQQDEEYHSDEDMFGSPEKDEELIKDSQSSFPKNITIEKNSEKSENSESMYEDNDGYFVTEKKKNSPKPTKSKQTKKEGTEKMIVDKEENKNKKQVNTNQKSILSFFQKK